MNNDNITINATIITKSQLNAIGIKLPDDQIEALIQYVEDTVNERIGEEIVDSLDDDQLKELVRLQDSGASDNEVTQWIKERIPDYDEIIEDNVRIVLGELVENSDAITASASSAN